MAPKKQDGDKIKRLKYSMIFGYTAIIIVLTLLISALAIIKTDTALKTKVSSMTADLNQQLKMNIESYIDRMETTGTLIFASEEVYTYDATDKSNDEYEALNTEKIISDKLFDLCIMENFVDFGIIYRNNHIVGKISNGTQELFGERMFEDLSSFINRPRTNDGWSTGYHDNYKRIYYTKRVNDNAVFVISFYTTELENVLEHRNGISDITIRVVESNNCIVYSSEDGELGKLLPVDISSRIKDKTSTAEMDDDYLITSNKCVDNWRVICSVPTEVILKEKNEVTVYILIVGTIAAIIAAAASILFSFKITDPVNNFVTVLDKKAHLDMLTGIMNKRSFEEKVDAAISSPNCGNRYALLLLDVDNFKGVNDTLGHAYGDKVLSHIGEILRSIFRSEDYLGRLGGDEFGVCIKLPSIDMDECISIVERKCSDLCDAFRNNYTGDNGDYKISASIGAAVSSEQGVSFNKLYRSADTALYKSKQTGKDTYTINTEEQQ